MANPPPPYDNITGISRAVMKDNAQETLGNYNGNARPGELVVDLTQDPPPLYVGNNAGQLTAVSSGNNVNAVTVDVTNTNGIDTNYYITFVENRSAAQEVRADVDLFFNSATNLLTAGGISVGAVSTPLIQSNANIQIQANTGTAQTWTFVTTGNLELPSEGNIVGVTPNNIGHLQWVGNSSGDGGGYTTMRLVPDNTVEAGDQYLIIDPTGGGHIHIRAGGTQDASNAILFIGGENSYVSIGSSSNPPVTIAANNYSWSFGVDSQFSAAGNIYTLGEVRSGSTVTPPLPLANLTATAGSRAFASDANLVAAGNFGQQVTGGASNTVPVWSDGTNWYIG